MAMVKTQKYVLSAMLEAGTSDVAATPPAGHVVEEAAKRVIRTEEFDNAQQLLSYLTPMLQQIAYLEPDAGLVIISMNIMRKTKYVDSNT